MDLVKPFRIEDRGKFRLADIDPGDTLGLDIEKLEAKRLLASTGARMRDLQERLYAESRRALLVVLQAMDAGGKDSAVEHVMSGINPQGCDVTSFKAPSSTELRQDFLRRASCALPERGRIGIFNRSYYEEVLIVRVHPEMLAAQNLPPTATGKHIWEDRFEDIRGFERYIARNGIVPLKFMLHVSKEEQRRRFLDRIEDPRKNWKIRPEDLSERKRWDEYMDAYQDMIRHTATKDAPWHVVPADNKWFARLVIAQAIVQKLEKLNPRAPAVTAEARKELEGMRDALMDEKG